MMAKVRMAGAENAKTRLDKKKFTPPERTEATNVASGKGHGA
jgi:hypothetical protein